MKAITSALLVTVLATVAIVVGASPVAADPPRPTDYRTDVVATDPVVPGLVVRVLGGDSFLEIEAPRGVTVVVTGYRGEAFARFLPDGRVEADHASYTWATSLSRYGSNPAAEQSSATDWRVVARDGSWAWHDHRSHWMSTARPVGRSPGQQVLEGVIPLTVDGVPVAVHLSTFWVAAPAQWPAVGAASATVIAMLLGSLLARRRPRNRASVLSGVTLAIVAALALVVGCATRVGLPPEAGVSPLHWILPAVALAVAVLGLVFAGRPSRANAAGLLGALALLEWVWWRSAVFTKPILPTALAPTADRVATAVVLVAALCLAAQAGLAFARSTSSTPRDDGRVATVSL